MSYDLRIVNKETYEPVMLPEKHQFRGGTFAIGGTPDASFNITYNYGQFYYDHLDKDKGLRGIYGKPLPEALSMLKKAIEEIKAKYPEVLGDDPPGAEDYWASTPFNAMKALEALIAITKMVMESGVPVDDLTWEGD